MNFDDKILVTGASGFIGSHVLRLLYQRGYMNLRAVVHTNDLRGDFKGSQNIETFKGDLRNADFCAEVTEGVDIVFHCAANTSNALDTQFNPLLHVTPNVEMAVNLLEQSWRNKVKKFLYVSSNTVYPDMQEDDCAEWMNVHATPLIPIYKGVGAMKRYGELLCDFFSNQIHNPMQCIIVRPSNGFGPNDKFDYEKCHVTAAIIRKVADGLNPIPVWGDGTETRDIMHVEDMADGFIYVMEKCDKYDIYNVSYGAAYSINTVLSWLKELDNNENPVAHVNNKAPMVKFRQLSSKKINALGWKPKKDLKEGLKETIEWYRANKHLFNPDSKP